MRIHCKFGMVFAIAVLASPICAQTPLTIITKQTLPAGSLWEPYSQRFEASGGIPPYHWTVLNGSLPPSMEFHDYGELAGTPAETASTEFTVLLRDSNSPPNQVRQKFVLKVETPLSADWNRAAYVNGNRIDGSVKVSNRTGRDFDLTFVVLAVNEIGRATAIGYQHFSLKKNTRDLSIPFGETLSRGNYAVNVDVVGEESVSGRIFRTRLVAKQAVTQGP